MKKATYHTHTFFCDGDESPEQMVQAAAGKDMTAIGFSAHAMYPYASPWHMELSRYDSYCAEIRRLKDKYSPHISVYCGFEADYIPVLSRPDHAVYKQFAPDYLIGSVHFIFADAGTPLFTADASEDEVRKGIETGFKGDGKKAVQVYFSSQRDMAKTCSFDIIGHPDVIRKRNGRLRFIDESDGWYRRELEETAGVFASSGKIVEINTGGIARGAIDSVYPSAEFLEILHRKNVPVVINSDAHKSADIDFAYETAVRAAKEAGYRETVFFENGSWQPYSL